MRDKNGAVCFDWHALLVQAARCGIQPEQFWRLCFFEFRAVVEGHGASMLGWKQLQAWACANIMSMWAREGTTITPGMLLGEKPTSTPVTDRDQLRRRAAELRTKARMEDV